MFFTRIQRRLHTFFTEPHSPKPLGIFRMLLAGFALLQAFLWYPDWLAFFGRNAWIQWEISQAVVPEISLHISKVSGWLMHLGISENQSVLLFFWIYVVSLIGLLAGYFTRVWAILAWFCHYVIMCSIDIYVYGVDIFLQIAFFYIMIMPVQKAYSLDARFRKINTAPTWGVTLSLRVLQIHLCLAYLSAGYEKMLSADWWTGNVIWRSLVQPDFRQYDFTWLARHPWVPAAAGWFTMFVETFYCVAIWVPRLRVFWLVAITLLHAGICIFLGLWLFGLIMILLSFSAFGYDAYCDVQNWRRRKNTIIKNKTAVYNNSDVIQRV